MSEEVEMPISKRFIVVFLSGLLAAYLWLDGVHLYYKPALRDVCADKVVPSKAKAMAKTHLRMWRDPARREQILATMRRSNAEWDFMGRTFLALSLCEMSLREPSLTQENLKVVDTIIDETIRLEKEHGMYFFLMPYAKAKPFVAQPDRSLFIESEIALMMAARQMVERRPEYDGILMERIDAMVGRLQSSPRHVMESYPDECWLFDHSMALAAIKISDYLDGRDHGAFCRQWLEEAKQTFMDQQTGLLISSFSERREAMDGPEGSSIWLATHCLRLVDEKFAQEQYNLAKQHLARQLCGFAWSREWPVNSRGHLDIDSGAVIPILDVSPGGSGLAFIAAASFGDRDYLQQLHTTLDFAAFPTREEGALRYSASNQVGDSVMLYSMVLGPMWELVNKGNK